MKSILRVILFGLFMITVNSCCDNCHNEKIPTITGYVIDDPIVGATIEVYDKDGNLVDSNITTGSDGKFTADLNSSKDIYIIYSHGGKLNNKNFLANLSAVCSKKENCYITPYTTLITSIMDNFSGSIEEKEEKAIKTVNNLLGINAYPFKNKNLDDIKLFKKAIGNDGSNLKNFILSFSDDFIDGYIDNNETIKIFTNAKKREIVKETFQIAKNIQDVNSSEDKSNYKLISITTNSLGDDSVSTKGYISDVALVETNNKEDNNTNVLYWAFNIGELKGKVNSSTQVAYDIFSNSVNLVLLPNSEKEKILSKLLKDNEFKEASSLYDELISFQSTNYSLYDNYIKSLTDKAEKLISDNQREQISKRIQYKLNNDKNVKFNKRLITKSERVTNDSVDLNIYDKNQVPYEIMNGTLLTINKGGEDQQIVFNFSTSNSLYYAVTDIDSYYNKDWMTSLLDPNLIDPKSGIYNGNALSNSYLVNNDNIRDYFKAGFINTAMNIANFDNDLKNINTQKQYIVYRSKEGIYLDAPFLLNVFNVVDIILDGMHGLSMTNGFKTKLKDKNWVKKAINGISNAQNNIKKFLEEHETEINIINAIYSASKAIALSMGVDITTLDQRYGQIDTFLNSIKNLFTFDEPQEGKNFKEVISEIQNSIRPDFIFGLIASLELNTAKQKKFPKNIYTIVSYYTFYTYAKEILEQYDDKTLKSKFNNPVKSEIASIYAKYELCKMNKSCDVNSFLTGRDIDIYKKTKDLMYNLLFEKNYKFGTYIINSLLKTTTSINNYIYKLKNLNASLDSDKFFIILKNWSIQIIKDSLKSLKENSINIAENVVESILVKTAGGGVVTLAKAANKTLPMVWDYATKPISATFKIKRLNENEFNVIESVPPVFDNINYLLFEDSNYVLNYAAKDILLSSKEKNILVMLGAKYNFNNVAVINNEDVAQSYFEKHEDDNVIFANWHVYQQKSFDLSDLRKDYPIDESTAFVNINTGKKNYWEFAMTGESIDCIHGFCRKENEEYIVNKGNNFILNKYLWSHGKEKLKYFSFDKFWRESGHKGGGTAQTPGIYTINSALWIGQDKEVKYNSKFNILVLTDYDYYTANAPSHKDVLLDQSSYSLNINNDKIDKINFYFKLYRKDHFNFFQNWSKFKHGNDFYVYFVNNNKFQIKPITLGEDKEYITTLSSEELKELSIDKNNYKNLKIFVIDSILYSYIKSAKDINEIVFLDNLNQRQENNKPSRPLMYFELKQLKEKKIKKIDYPTLTFNIIQKDGKIYIEKLEISDDNYSRNIKIKNIEIYDKDGNLIKSIKDTNIITGLSNGNYIIKVTALLDDGRELTQEKEFEVKKEKNTPPTAKAKATPTSIKEGESVTLDGSESYDVEDSKDDLTYEWSWETEDGIKIEDGVNITVPNLSVGEHIFTLTVTDSEGESSSANVKVVVINANSDINLKKGLVAHYEFEGNAKDSSGNGNDGVAHGGVTYVDGVIGKAAKFDGVDDYIEISKFKDNLKLVDTSFTISAWTYVENKGDVDKPIFYLANQSNGVCSNCIDDGYQFWYGWEENRIFLSKPNKNSFDTSSTNYNNWKMITMVFNKITGNVSYFENGNLVKNISNNSSIKEFIANNPAFIGFTKNYSGTYFNGLIDDLRIYNRALSEEEIKALYEMGKNKVNIENEITSNKKYLFDNGFIDSISNKDDKSLWSNSENVIVENGYLKLINTYDNDPKRYVKVTIDTSSINSLIIEKRTKLTAKDNYTYSSTLIKNSFNENLVIVYNNYHYNNGNLDHIIENKYNEHFYLYNTWDIVDENNFKYKVSDLFQPIWNKWFYERLTIDYKNKIATYEVSEDGKNYKKVYINDIHLKRDENTVLSLRAWDWASGSEHYIDYLKIEMK